MEINLIILVIAFIIFIVSYGFIVYKIMKLNSNMTSLQSEVAQTSKSNDNLSSTIRQLSNDIIIPKNIDDKPTIGAVIIQNGVTTPIFCSMQNLTEDMDLSIKNTEFFLMVFPGYKLELYSQINFRDLKITLDMNNKEQFGAKTVIRSGDIKSFKLFYKGTKVKIDGITNSKIIQ